MARSQRERGAAFHNRKALTAAGPPLPSSIAWLLSDRSFAFDASDMMDRYPYGLLSGKTAVYCISRRSGMMCG